MKHTCISCNIQFKLYNNFRRHLETNEHYKKSKKIVSKEDLKILDLNRQKLLKLIRSS